jgi:hypothetical protein
LYSTERIPLPGGSELVTIFEEIPQENTRVPLLCVLRDNQMRICGAICSIA